MTDPLDDPIGLEVALASGAPPDLLVPCDVEGLLDAAQALRSHASVLEDGGAALARVEVTNWRGRAADGFTDVLTPEPARWRAAADGFSAGAVALEAFVACIAPARSTASDAIALWQRYLATAAAAADVAQAPVQPTVGATMQIGARLAQQQQAAATSPTAAALTADADDLRRQAITTLAAARRQVQSAGDVAASTLSRAADAAPQARRFWETTIRPADVIAAGHSALDVLGMVPALGAIPDAANACWYALKGDGVNAALSAAGTIPFFGDGVVGGRLMTKAGSRASKAGNTFPLFRGMRQEGEAGPELGRSAKTLGVRLDVDITPGHGGLVHPGTGGMSASVDIDGIRPIRKPPEFGGTDKTLTMYSLDSGRLGEGLIYVRDSGSHGTIQPSMHMSLDDYEDLLTATRQWWSKVVP